MKVVIKKANIGKNVTCILEYSRDCYHIMINESNEIY